MLSPIRILFPFHVNHVSQTDNINLSLVPVHHGPETGKDCLVIFIRKQVTRANSLTTFRVASGSHKARSTLWKFALFILERRTVGFTAKSLRLVSISKPRISVCHAITCFLPDITRFTQWGNEELVSAEIFVEQALVVTRLSAVSLFVKFEFDKKFSESPSILLLLLSAISLAFFLPLVDAIKGACTTSANSPSKLLLMSCNVM